MKGVTTMKKTLKLMGLCALAVLALAGCKKNEQNGNMTFKATISQLNNNAKTEIGSGNWLVWNDGDQIKVYTANKTEASAANFNIASGAGTTDATFSGDLAESDTYYAFYPTTGVELTTEGKFKLPVSGTQTFVDANFTTNTFPMCATATDGNFTFHSPYGILGIPMKGTATIGSIVLTDSLGMLLEGYYEMNDVDTTFVGNSAAITLSFGEGLTLSADTAKTAYFVVPAGALSNGFKADVKGTDGNRIVLLETLTPNTITAETIHLMPEVTGVTATPTGTISGLYSVSDTQLVYFSQGNLMYSNGTWSFHENQYDLCFTSDGNKSANYNASGTFDLFGWGTSNYNHGAASWRPWSTAPNYNQYYAYGSYTKNLYDAKDDGSMQGQADWGYNEIHCGAEVIPENSGWRTLTHDEWHYVLMQRAASTVNGVENARYAFGFLGSVKGVFLFPDVYTHPDGLPQPVDINGYNMNNNYTVEQFALMEANGAVFLPCGGRGQQANLSGANNLGHYWSSTRYGQSYAYDVYIYSWGQFSTGMNMERFYECSVRLCLNAN